MSARGDILAALFALLSGLGVTALRNASLPAKVPASGLIIMRDGDPGEPSQFFGGAHLIEHYRHEVEVEVYSAADEPEAQIYSIADMARGAVSADPGLGGLANGTSARDIEVSAIAVDDGAPMVAGVLIIEVRYTAEV